MEVFLVRHTTPNIGTGICYGQTDIDVTTTFEEEYREIHTALTFDHNTKIYSSPLLRCKNLAKTFGNPIQHDNRLMELDFGKWEMQAWKSIEPREIKPWMQDFVTAKVPNGESYEMLQQRVISFFNEVIVPAKENSIIISHAGAIRALLAHIANIPLKDSFSIQLNYGHVIRLENKGTTFVISKGLILK